MSGSSLRRFVPRAVRGRHARKLTVAFLVVVVSLSAIGGVLYVQASEEVERRTASELESTAEVQATELARWVDATRERARLLSRSDAVRSRDPARVESFLNDEVGADGEGGRLAEEVAAIHYVNTDRFVIEASTDEAFVGVDPREQGVPWATRDLSFSGPGDTVVTDPFDAPNVDSPVIAVLSPVPDQPDRLLVVMVSLERRVASMPRPAGADSYTVVVDGDGENVLAHDTSLIGRQHVGDAGVESTAVRRGLDGTVGYDRIPVGGERTAIGYAPVEGVDWVVVTHTPVSEAFALQGLIARSLLAMLGAALLGLGGVVLAIGRPTARALDDLADRATAIDDGDLTVDIDRKEGRTDEIGRLYRAVDSMRSSLRDRIEEAERERERMADLNDRLEARAEAYGDTMRAAARGDMTVRMDEDAENDAMASVAEEFNAMIGDLEATTAALGAFAEAAAAASGDVADSATEVREAGREVSASVQTISEGADAQRERFRTVSTEMGDLSASTQEIAASADRVADLAADTADAAATGRERADEAERTMEEVAAEARRAVEEFERLRTEIDEVADLVETVDDVADRTNRLALNANIEASRAGGDAGDGREGDGFDVVAEEIRDLAADAKTAAGEADDLLTDLRERTGETAREVRHTSEKAEQSVDTVADVASTLERIADYAAETADGVAEVSDAADDQAESTEEVVAAVESAADVADDTAEEADRVAAAAEEQAASLSTVTDGVDGIADRADRLAELLARFRTREAALNDAPFDFDPGAAAGDSGPDRDADGTPPVSTDGGADRD